MAAKSTRKVELLTRGGEAPTRRSSHGLRTRPSTASLDLVLDQASVGIPVAPKATPCKPPPYSTKPPPTSSSAASATPEVETGLFKYTAYVRDRALATPSPAAPVKRKNDHAGGSVSKRLRTTFGEVAAIVVGEDEQAQTFHVHKDILCEHSKFFKAALTGARWTEASDKTVKLPGYQPKIFQAYVEWCYLRSGDLADIVEGIIEVPASSDSSRRSRRTCFLYDLWMLNDYLGDDGFRTSFIESLLRLSMDHNEAFSVISYATSASNVLEDLSDESPLWRWTVDVCAAGMNTTAIDMFGSGWSKKLVLAVLRRVTEDGFLRRRFPSMKDHEKYKP